jgi:hypothetical protein
MKKLLIGTALASTMFVAAIAQAETKVSGYYELNYRAISNQTTGAVDSPNAAFGTEMDINIASTNTLSNGMVLDIFVGTSNEGGGDGINAGGSGAANNQATKNWGTDSYGLSLTSGSTTFDISTDRGNTLDMISDVVPNPVDQPADNISVASTARLSKGLPAASTDAVQATTHMTVTQVIPTGKLAVTFNPSTSNAETSTSGFRNDSANSGLSGYSLVYSGSVMPGLNVAVGTEKVTGYERQDAVSTTYGFNYTSGAVSVGVQKASNDVGAGGTTETAVQSIDSMHYGITYKVSDALTIGAAVQTIDASNKASDEEYQQLEAAYSLGALGVGISYTQVENVNGAAGTDEDQLMVRLSSKL